MNVRWSTLVCALWLGAVAACSRQEAPPRPEATTSTSQNVGPTAPRNQLRIVEASETGDVAGIVRQNLAQAKAEGRQVLVYVGATWCEPCRHFHEAANRGELDAAFPLLTLVEFDLDRDRERLMAAGYHFEYIPLFSIPAEDGRSKGKQISGSIKGPRAVSDITPRLKALLQP